MRKELTDLAAGALATAKAAGADGAQVAVSTDRQVEVTYRERKPETIKEASTREMVVRLFVDGRYSSQGTSDLRPDALQRFITDAVSMTRLLAADPFRSLPDPKYYAGRVERDLGLFDPGYTKLEPTDRHDMAKAIEDACLSKAGAKVISVTSRAQDSHAEEVLLSSNGFEGYEQATGFAATATVTLQDEGDRRPMGYDWGVSVKRAELPRPEVIGAGAAERTLALLGGRKMPTETTAVIVENRNVARLLGGLLQAMGGRAVQQKQSFLADKKGQKIGSELLTLVDDPFVPQGLGSRLYDGDGMTAQQRTMIEAGVLRDFYVDWYYSRKLGWEPTTGSASNLIIPPGKRSVREIMKDLGHGILITDFIGGNANSTTGDQSVGILGVLFDKGEPQTAVAEMNIAGNALGFWPKLIEVANDPWPYASQRTPSLVFRDMVVSGV